jgi:hypothetical protein
MNLIPAETCPQGEGGVGKARRDSGLNLQISISNILGAVAVHNAEMRRN